MDQDLNRPNEYLSPRSSNESDDDAEDEDNSFLLKIEVL